MGVVIREGACECCVRPANALLGGTASMPTDGVATNASFSSFCCPLITKDGGGGGDSCFRPPLLALSSPTLAPPLPLLLSATRDWTLGGRTPSLLPTFPKSITRCLSPFTCAIAGCTGTGGLDFDCAAAGGAPPRFRTNSPPANATDRRGESGGAARAERDEDITPAFAASSAGLYPSFVDEARSPFPSELAPATALGAEGGGEAGGGLAPEPFDEPVFFITLESRRSR
eukprot:jgi/Bigna1/77457/fgenesh1_pg.48_\